MIGKPFRGIASSCNSCLEEGCHFLALRLEPLSDTRVRVCTNPSGSNYEKTSNKHASSGFLSVVRETQARSASSKQADSTATCIIHWLMINSYNLSGKLKENYFEIGTLVLSTLFLALGSGSVRASLDQPCAFKPKFPGSE